MELRSSDQGVSKLIVVSAEHQEDVSAEAVDLHLTVQGSSLVTGAAALRKAREVSRLVEALEVCGLEQDAISLEGVQAEVKSGLITRSSSTTYRLRIRCSLDILADALGVVTSAKQAQLGHLDWIYPESAEQQAGWLAICVAKAHVKAEAIAQASGAKLVGIHRITERPLGQEEAPFVDPQLESAVLRRRAPAAPRIELGFELAQKRRDGCRISAEYLVEGFRGE